jgi:hypothetical protein
MWIHKRKTGNPTTKGANPQYIDKLKKKRDAKIAEEMLRPRLAASA